jgi:two-component system LytT family response regulator
LVIDTLIVDDEPAARLRVRSLLALDPEIAVVGESGDGPGTVAAIKRLKPSLVFLDVEMPGGDGFGVLRKLDEIPTIVFVTAHQNYAIRAFEACALDYLLKPFKRLRFFDVLARAKSHIRLNSQHYQRQVAMRHILSAEKPADLLIIKSEGRLLFLKMSDVKWIEAQRDYVRVHLQKESHFIRETMNSIQSRLDQNKFIRIHRSAIVSLNEIAEIRPLLGGDYHVVLRDRTQLTLSRRYRALIDRLLHLQRANLPRSV